MPGTVKTDYFLKSVARRFNYASEPSAHAFCSPKITAFDGTNQLHDGRNKFRHVLKFDAVKRLSPYIETQQSKILSTPGLWPVQSLYQSHFQSEKFRKSSQLAVGFFTNFTKLIAIPHGNMQSL